MLYPGGQMSSSSAAAASSSASEQMETAAAPSTPSSEEPTVVWSSTSASTSGKLTKPFASVVSGRERSSSRASKRSNKGGNKGGNGPPSKKKRVLYDYKINIWNGQGAVKEPISLADWRIMNVQLCAAAAGKMRSCGPPKGGVGQKHWMEHSDGTKKTSELPDTQRMGHTVIRFSTIEAQDWYKPLVEMVLGIAQDGKPIKLITEIEEDDGRARYVFSLPAADFHAFGKTKAEREELLVDSVLAATGAERAIIGPK